VETEWSNIQNKINKPARESLWRIRIQRRKKCLKIWDDEIKTLIEEKQKAYNRWLYLRTTEDYIENKRLSAKTKKEIRKRKRLSWEKFLTQLEHNL
jgi:hypothetical protein